MPLNRKYKDSFWYFDEYGMLLKKDGWGDNGRGDSLGINAFEWIVYPNDNELKKSVQQCIKYEYGRLKILRHPNLQIDNISRDHVGAVILALYLNGEKSELNFILNNLKWRLSNRYIQTPDFWLWQKSIYHQSWVLAQVFYLTVLIQMIVIIPWNFLLRTIIGIKKVKDLDEWEFKPLTGWRKLLFKAVYPHFALFFLAWQIRSLPDSWLKTLVQKIARIEANNTVIKATLGRKITKEEYKQYRPTSCFLWSRRQDTSDDIMMEYLTEPEYRFNDISKDMLDYFYTKQQ